MISFDNAFFKYLSGFIWFDQDRLEALMKRYPIGVTEQGEPIFWHINAENKITNGHILTMGSETSKVYDDSWYYQDGRPTCLFGEHLLGTFPSQTLALVSDEMTAAIMSSFPHSLRLAGYRKRKSDSHPFASTCRKLFGRVS